MKVKKFLHEKLQGKSKNRLSFSGTSGYNRINLRRFSGRSKRVIVCQRRSGLRLKAPTAVRPLNVARSECRRNSLIDSEIDRLEE
jgi:hypothetical protein